MEEWLHRLIAQAGIAARRKAELLIEEGRVTVNGQPAKPGDKADPEQDDIRVDGTRLRLGGKRVYIIIHKPKGVVTTISAQRQERRRTVRDLVPVEGRLFIVGSLDVDSQGLVLLTDDGELAQKLTHPRYGHTKVCEVVLNGHISDERLDSWRRGVVLDGGPTHPVEIQVLSRERGSTRIRITMREGRKRQIRRIANALGHPVKELTRIELDTLKLGTLKPGEWRHLSDSEVRLLQQHADSVPHRGKVARLAQKDVTSPKAAFRATAAARPPRPSSSRRAAKQTRTAYRETGPGPSRPTARRRSPRRNNTTR